MRYATWTSAQSQNTSKDTEAVDVTSILYDEMALRWELIHDLLGGTLRMREASTRWVPRQPREDVNAYAARVSQLFLYEAYADTVEKLLSKPFGQPVTIEGVLPEPLDLLEDDADKDGSDISVFTRRVFRDALNHGITHVLVDYPSVDPGINLADQRAIDARPYFVSVSASDLIGWRSKPNPGGGRTLTQIRIREQACEAAGVYGEQVVDYVRVYTETEWELWKKGPDDKTWAKVDGAAHTFGRVPLATIYFNRTGFMTANPPMEALAWLNLAHLQSASDQRGILRFARCGILFGKGVSEEDREKDFAVGPGRIFWATNSDADLKIVEHSGDAINSGKEDLLMLEDQMQVLGLQPLMERTGSNPTATGSAITEAKTHANIHSWIEQVQDGMEAAFGMAAEWAGATLADDFAFKIFSDFGIGLEASSDIEWLLKARLAGEISRETFLQEIKRRGKLSDTINVDDEMARIDAEGPSLAEMGLQAAASGGPGPDGGGQAGAKQGGAGSGSAAAA